MSVQNTVLQFLQVILKLYKTNYLKFDNKRNLLEFLKKGNKISIYSTGRHSLNIKSSPRIDNDYHTKSLDEITDHSSIVKYVFLCSEFYCTKFIALCYV